MSSQASSATAPGFTYSAREFGSRTDDARRGGDIDLLVEPDVPMSADSRLDAKLKMLAALHRRLGERKIDLIFRQPDRQESTFQRLAREQGIRL